MRNTKIATLAVAGVLGLSLAACGSSSTPSTGSSASASADTAPVATVPDLSKGVSTAVTLDPAFLKALTDLKVTPAPIGKATLDGAVLTFPITGGNVTVFKKGAVDPYVTGKIMHDGSGLSLEAGGTKVDLENFVVDPGTSVLTGKVSANGAEVAPSANLFFLDGSTLKPLATEGNNAILEGTTVKLHPDAAALLRKTYNLTEAQLPDYFTVGVAKITVATK